MTAQARWSTALLALTLALPSLAMTSIDIASLWNFQDPAASEQRFRDALATAQGDDRLILVTQIARSQGMRRDFEGARRTLAGIEREVAAAGPEARVRHALELGRTWVSAAHPKDALTPAAREQARGAYRQALATAREASLDGLAVDTLHMLAFVDDAPADALRWTQQALDLSLASTQPAARRWEASLRNNLGMALHEQKRYDEALAQFRAAVAVRERGSDAGATRVAHWMVAWTLRSMGRLDEALDIQLRLERECDAAGQPDAYVYEELAALYTARGDAERARHYGQKQAALQAK